MKQLLDRYGRPLRPALALRCAGCGESLGRADQPNHPGDPAFCRRCLEANQAAPRWRRRG